MDDDRSDVACCRGCGVVLAEFHVAHFRAGRRSTTLELLCPTHGCEHHDRPDTAVGHHGGTSAAAGTARRRDGSAGATLPTQRRHETSAPAKPEV